MSFTFVFYRSLLLSALLIFFLLAAWPGARRSKALIATSSIVLSIHAIWLFLPDLPTALGRPGRWLVSMWVATLVAATLLLVPIALIMLIRRVSGSALALTDTMAAVYLYLCLLVGFAVSVTTVRGPVVRESTVTIAGLPGGLDGLRIANIGDVHIGRFIAPDDLAEAVDIVNEQRVDLLAITGDLIDDLRLMEPALDALERSKALPVMSILGNHDKHPNEAAVVAALKNRDPRIQVIINSSVVVHPRGIALRIAGSDYPLATDGRHMIPREEQDAMMRSFADKAFAEVTSGDTVIALSHHPEFFPFAVAKGAILTLASHTHGGQVAIFGRPLIAAYDYMHGVYQQQDSFLDVTSGLGHWLPLRIGVPREISIITLRRG